MNKKFVSWGEIVAYTDGVIAGMSARALRDRDKSVRVASKLIEQRFPGLLPNPRRASLARRRIERRLKMLRPR